MLTALRRFPLLTRILPMSQGCSALKEMSLRPPRSFRPASPLAVGTHTMKKRDKKSFKRSLAE